MPGSYRFCRALLLVLLWATSTFAIPLNEYRDQVKKAIDSVNLLSQTTEGRTELQQAEFVSVNLGSARSALPLTETVEWQGTSFTTDNSWFAHDLERFEKLTGSPDGRARVLDRIRERLHALQDRLEETSKGEQTRSLSDDELRGRLAAILPAPGICQRS